ncbi:hypothetical protein EXU85_13055 [Spirosoma sp. KCTC 42546]|uniref:hypothetical protein n=1 Tax=Spirosoma sp. KCTC 42546 TaxID=2520506 RepID=UPI00115B1820|nr:hypothetical protein [Spirosoma sp. KCTC 42546]QDK79482.1 hypothetical protein EXU85_13055 [Spirosoma sp. KCTC 42546]
MYRQLYVSLTILVAMTTTFTQAQVEYNTIQNVRISAPSFASFHGVEGSPYIPSDTVRNGWLVVGNKRVVSKLRYNSQTGQVEYAQGNQIVTPVNAVADFVILEPDTVHFQKGFPAIGTRSTNDFYQILFDGRKTKLVRFIYSTVKINNDAMSDDYGKKKYTKREDYYVWVSKGQPAAENYFVKLADGEMNSVLATKKSLVSLFPKNADQIERYIADQKLKLKSWSEFAGVLRFLETQ